MEVIINLNNGPFSTQDGKVKVQGNLNVNEGKINNINGQVANGEDNLGSFDAWRNGESLSFNLHPVNIKTAGALATAVSNSVDAVEAELAPAPEE